MVGVLTGQLLLPSALSILGGLAESIFNIKAGDPVFLLKLPTAIVTSLFLLSDPCEVLFPGHREFPFLLILTSFEAVPIYSALMAVPQLLPDLFS